MHIKIVDGNVRVKIADSKFDLCQHLAPEEARKEGQELIRLADEIEAKQKSHLRDFSLHAIADWVDENTLTRENKQSLAAIAKLPQLIQENRMVEMWNLGSAFVARITKYDNSTYTESAESIPAAINAIEEDA